MPVIPFVVSMLNQPLAIPLCRYAQIMDYSESAMFGVRQDGQDQYACRTIWTKWQRQAIGRELLAAQGEFWKHAHYPFTPTYITGEVLPYKNYFMTKNTHLLGLGLKTQVDVGLTVTLDDTNDPETATVASVTFTDVNEVHIFHAGTEYEIMPSKLEIVAGDLNIEIPRARLVLPAYENNPADGWDYTDDTYFQTDIDVKRIYLDTTQQITVTGYSWAYGCLTPETCTDSGIIKNADIGSVKLACMPSCYCSATPKELAINYLCGLTSLDPHQEDAIIRLAHSRMPSEPCGCDWLKMRWEQDKHVPDVLTAERENAPWGQSDGAWASWVYLCGLTTQRAGII
jgi:hypothetical protein